MKKQNKFLIILFAFAVILCVAVYWLMPRQPKEMVVVQHRNDIIFSFDLNKDGIYQVEGDIGIINIEVRDGRYHVFDVECPNHDCESMGWADRDSLIPIICLPNNISIYMN